MSDGTNSKAVDRIDRARQISAALSEVARLARFSTRAKRSYAAGGFGNRRGAAFLRIAVQASFALCVAIPALAVAIYYAFIASDQYVATARFAVSTGQPIQIDGIGSLTGLAAASIVRDTQIVTQYIGSRAAVEKIETLMPLREKYARDGVDWVARFNPKRPIEKFVTYWKGMVETSISMPAGIVELSVRAFDPEDARDIANTILKVSEDLINEQNAKIEADTLSLARSELDRAAERLGKARIALEKARNAAGFLDVEKANEVNNALIIETRKALIALQQDYATKSTLIDPSMPQMKVLKERIDGMTAQVQSLEAAAARADAGADPSLSKSMTEFSQLEMEVGIAEKQYAGAAANVEIARVITEQKMMYLNAFVAPALPEEARYPRRVLYTFGVGVSLLAAWGLVVGLGMLVRNHMA